SFACLCILATDLVLGFIRELCLFGGAERVSTYFCEQGARPEVPFPTFEAHRTASPSMIVAETEKVLCGAWIFPRPTGYTTSSFFLCVDFELPEYPRGTASTDPVA